MARKPKNVDLELVTPERRAEIKAEAARKVQAKRIEAAEAELLAREIEEAEHADDPVYEKRDILIDLPGHSAFILLDGTHFHHGHRYTVVKPVFDMLQGMVDKAWEHEEEIGGANRRDYVKPTHNRLSASSARMNF